jgi:hypothetical protein
VPEPMTVAEQLQALARKLPGVAGYQDREAARDTDKQLRLRLAGEIGRLKRALQSVAQREAERRAFTILPLLDRLGAKLDRLANLIRFAGRGYRGLFDSRRPSQSKLRQLYEFDIQLLVELESVASRVEVVQAAEGGGEALERECRALDEAVEAFGEIFARRETVLGEQ